jgi:hypothetical protein
MLCDSPLLILSMLPSKRALNCTRHQSISMHIAAAIPNINEVFW